MLRIGRRGRVDVLGHVRAPAHLRAKRLEAVEGVRDVLGRERLAVAPVDALRILTVRLLEVLGVLVGLGSPEDLLVGEDAEKYANGSKMIWFMLDVFGADRVGAPDVRDVQLAVTALERRHQRSVARRRL